MAKAVRPIQPTTKPKRKEKVENARHSKKGRASGSTTWGLEQVVAKAEVEAESGTSKVHKVHRTKLKL
jgi:predicted GNAT family acetyltransferase